MATGGGAVLRRANWGHMSHAISVWLDGPPPLLAARLVADGTASRPLVAGSEVKSAGGWCSCPGGYIALTRVACESVAGSMCRSAGLRLADAAMPNGDA